MSETQNLTLIPIKRLRQLPGKPIKYTVGDLADAMQQVIAARAYLFSSHDHAALVSLEENTWVQLAVAAMLATAGDLDP